MKKRIASMLAATVMLLSVIALPASAQTDWLGNSDLTTAKVREIADADTLTQFSFSFDFSFHLFFTTLNRMKLFIGFNYQARQMNRLILRFILLKLYDL